MALYQNSLHVLQILNDLRQKSDSLNEYNQLIALLEDPFFQRILTIKDSLQSFKYYTESYAIPNLTARDFAISPKDGLILSPNVVEWVESHPKQFTKSDGSELSPQQKDGTTSTTPQGKQDGETYHYTLPRETLGEAGGKIASDNQGFNAMDSINDASPSSEITIRLFRPENRSLGVSILGLQNESNDSVGVFVKDIDPDGIAGRNGQLKEGDQIVAINGVRLNDVSHHEAISLLQNAKGPLNLVVERKTFPSLGSIDLALDSIVSSPQPTVLHDSLLQNLNQSRVAPGSTQKRFVYQEEENLTEDEIPKSIGIENRANDDENTHNSSDNKIMVLDTEFTEIEKIDLTNDGTGLGFGIAGGRSTGVVVKSLVPGSIAHVDGRLKIGDHILQIDNVNLRGMNSEQVASVLRHCGTHVDVVVAREVIERPLPIYNPNSVILPTKLLNEQLGLDIPPIHILRSVLPNESELTTEESFESSEENESFDRVLRKGPHGLGMTIAGYIGDEISGVFVKSIAPGSPADMDGKIRVNDQIIEVDGKSLEGLTNQEAVEVLKNTGNEVHLMFIRYLKGSKHDQLENHIDHEEIAPATKISPSETILAQLLREEEKDYKVSNGYLEKPPTISPIVPTMDNHVVATQLGEHLAKEHMTQDDLEMRDLKRKWLPLLHSDVELVVAEFNKFREGGGLGISLEGTIDVEDGREMHPHHYIRSILPDGPLGLNGKLRSGDELLEVNGQLLYGKNHREVVKVLKELPLSVKIICARHLQEDQKSHNVSNNFVNGIIKAPTGLYIQERPFTPEEQPLNSFKSTAVSLPFEHTDSGDRLFKAKSEGSISLTNTFGNSFPQFRSRSLEPLTGLAMWSTEPLVIELIKGDRGLGFSILDYQDPINPDHTVIVIRSLVPGGQAQLDGRILPGDRLLFVNDKNLEEVSLDTAVQALKSVPRGVVKIGIAKPVPLEEGLIENLFPDTSKEIEEPSTDFTSTLNESSLEIPLNESGRESADITPDLLSQRINLSLMDGPSLLAIKDQNELALDDEDATKPTTYKSEMNFKPATFGFDKNERKMDIVEAPPLAEYSEIPLPQALERTMKIKKGSLPFGISLKTEGSGGNGCLVTAIDPDGAIKKDGRLKVGDYLTSLNNESLRYVTGSQAKSILARIALISTDISVNYIPSDDAAIHNQSVLMALESQSQSDSQNVVNLIPQLTAQQLEIYIQYVDRLMSLLIKDIIDVLRQMKREGSKVSKRKKSLSTKRKSMEFQNAEILTEGTISSNIQPQSELLKRLSIQSPQIEGEQMAESYTQATENVITPPRSRSIESLEIQKILGNESPDIEKSGNQRLAENKTSQNNDSQNVDENEKRTIIPEDDRWSPPRFVELIKEENQSYGLSIVGGTIESDLNPDFDAPVAGIFIKNVFPNGPASKNGMLKTGDRILEINDYRVYNSSLDEAVKIIRESKNSVKFLVQSLMGSNLIPYTFTFTPKKTDAMPLITTSSPLQATPKDLPLNTNASFYLGHINGLVKPGESMSPNSDISHDYGSEENLEEENLINAKSSPPSHKKMSTTSAIISPQQISESTTPDITVIQAAPLSSNVQPTAPTIATQSLNVPLSESTSQIDSYLKRPEGADQDLETANATKRLSEHQIALPKMEMNLPINPLLSPQRQAKSQTNYDSSKKPKDTNQSFEPLNQAMKRLSKDQLPLPNVESPSSIISPSLSFQKQLILPKETASPQPYTRTTPVSTIIPSPCRPSVVKFSDADIIVHPNTSKIETSFKPISPHTSPPATKRLPTPVKVNYKTIDQLKREFFEGKETGSDSLSIDDNSTPSSSPEVSPSKPSALTRKTADQESQLNVPITRTELESENPFRRISLLNADLSEFKKALHPPHVFPYKPISLKPLALGDKSHEVLIDWSSKPTFTSHHIVSEMDKHPEVSSGGNAFRPVLNLPLNLEPPKTSIDESANRDLASLQPIGPTSLKEGQTVLSSPDFSSSSSSTERSVNDIEDLKYHLEQLEISREPYKHMSLPNIKPELPIRDLRSKSLIPPLPSSSQGHVETEDFIKKETTTNSSGTKITYIIDDKCEHGLSIESSPSKSSNVTSPSSNAEDQSPKHDKIKSRYSDLPGDIHIIELYKSKSGKLGLSLAGNKDRNKLSVFVVGISSEEAEKKIMVGDEILEANNHILFGRSHLNASSILKNLPSPKIKLIILRRDNGLEDMAVKPLKPNLLPPVEDINQSPIDAPTSNVLTARSSISSPLKKSIITPPRQIQDTFDLMTCLIVPDQPTLIHLEKHGRPLGLSLTGGQDTLLGYIIIEEVHKDGAADKDGRLKVNDIILEVNGENLRKSSLEFAKEYIYQPQTHLTLLINRYSDQLQFDKKFYENQMVDLIKKPGKSLGISIKDRSASPRVIISHVLKGSIADMDGRLKVGDQIVEVNFEDVQQSSQEDVALTLKGLIGKISLKVKRLKPASSDPNLVSKVPLTDKILKLKLSSESLQELVSHHGKFTLAGKSSSPNKKVGNITLIQISRTNDEGLGIKLEGTGISSQTQVTEPITVTEVELGSLADGKIESGDRILSVNGQSLENMSLSQANNLLKTLTGTISFEIAKANESP